VRKMHQRPAVRTRKSVLPVNEPGDRFEREAHRVADDVVRGESAGAPIAGSPGSTVQRTVHADGNVAFAPDLVTDVLQGSGQPLDGSTQSTMEDRLGFDFSRVRIHTDAQAAESARAVRARAYTVGSDVVFGAGQYAPRSLEGQRLIAHELTHVRQQSMAPPMLRRWNIFNEIAGWFAGDSFDNATLTTYLAERQKARRIEAHSDSDNKARAIVAAWKKDRSSFNLTPALKVILIKEMQSGFTGDDDERAILDLLNSATDEELTQFFTAEGLSAKSVESDFHGSEDDALLAFFSERFVGGFQALKRGEVKIKTGQEKAASAAQAGKAATEGPRADYVFIMGEDSPKAKKENPFYSKAEKYFRIHYPKADIITQERTLDGLLSFIDRNIDAPIGNLFIVSHGNEDGTLSFGLDAADLVKDPAHPKSLHGDSHLSPIELKEALHPSSGKSTLPTVSGKIDANTTIHIRGCDLGQNKEFVNLIDEAFGGKGQVIASTHEQVYGTDDVLAGKARAKARKEIEDSEPMPPPVDRSIKDKTAKKAAAAEHAKAVKERQGRIAQKLRDQAEEIDAAAALAGSYEAMSGVVMQRPGETKFTEAEVTAEIDRRYQHLGKKQRADLAKRVFVGQAVQKETFTIFRGNVPINSAQALSVFASNLREASFVPDRKRPVEISTTKQDDGTESKQYKFFDANAASIEVGVSDIPVSDEKIFSEAKSDSPNPQNYSWEVTRPRVGARLTVSAVAKRVFADLHHQSLNVSKHEPFSPKEDNPIFYVRSSYEPKETGKKEEKKK
jgi:hypothetical protein